MKFIVLLTSKKRTSLFLASIEVYIIDLGRLIARTSFYLAHIEKNYGWKLSYR